MTRAAAIRERNARGSHGKTMNTRNSQPELEGQRMPALEEGPRELTVQVPAVT
jgi:hypothetical protein